jgi:hypothetical protein
MLLVKLARSRGIEEGSSADVQLSEWLASPPPPEVFTRATRLIRAMLEAVSAQAGDLTADDLLQYCESIASASGGILGMGRISPDERAMLSQIAAELKTRHQPGS